MYIRKYGAVIHASRRNPTIQCRMPGEKNAFLSISKSEDDLISRRRERNMKDVIERGRKQGVGEEALRSNCRMIGSLLPDVELCCPQKMKASDWVKVLSRPEGVAETLVVLKQAYPSSNISRVISKSPKLLLEATSKLQLDADEVKNMLSQEGLNDDQICFVVESVPDLLKPSSLVQSLSNLRRWLPNQQAKDILLKSPQMLLNIDECDLEANPSYGENSYFFVDRAWAPEVQSLPSLPSD